MRIFTLTLSPAFDNYCRAETLLLNKENLVVSEGKVAGGKGINISRALQMANIPNTAIALLGRENGEEFARQLSAQGVDLSAVWCDGKIRENITIATHLGETRISFDSPLVQSSVLDEIFADLCSQMNVGDVLTVTGRLPEGITAADMMPYLEKLKCKGVLLVIDSKSFSLNELLGLSPWLVKPNEEEILQYCNSSVTTLADACVVAKELHDNAIANVIISLGAKGAVLVNEDGKFVCKAPSVLVRSTVGAGDSSIAGFITAHYLGLTSAQKLGLCVAFGSAACLSESSLPPKQEDIKEIYQSLNI